MLLNFFESMKGVGLEKVVFHPELLTISLFNLKKIKLAYSDILGMNYIDHFSINIINPRNEIVFLSSTPNTGINICSTDLWKHDLSIHPSIFNNKKFFFWDDCYAEKFRNVLKIEKEKKNNLELGFVCVRKKNGFVIEYSFGSKFSNKDFVNDLPNMQNLLFNMGDHCYDKVRQIYQNYSGGIEPPIL